MGLIKNLLGRFSLNKLFFSKKELDALRSKSHEQEQTILMLEEKIRYQESVLQSFRPLYNFERTKIHNKFEYFQQMWMTWGIEIHETYYQIRRQSRATDSIYTPLSFDADTGKAYFRGKECDYCTTLLSCDCHDFQYRNMPCKHMYRLAYELDVYMLDDIKVNPNISNLPYLQDVVAIVNKLHPPKKQLFSHILYSPLYTSKTEVKSLLDAELIQICADKTLLLNHYKKGQLPTT